jgi:vacuolar-type H+-ATPase subunit C/Vma6
MKTRWEDLTARARGLATHLISGEALERLARIPDLPGLARQWPELGLPAVARDDAVELELSARREAARRLRVLGRWLGDRTRVLAVFFADEDRRSIRAVVRGAMAGITRDARLSGLIPTPELPERLLEELASQDSPGKIAGLLTAWGHPFGSPLLDATGEVQPDLARIEIALHRAYAAQAIRGAKAGGSLLAEYVAETIDLLNAETALMLAGAESEIPAEEGFLEGGTTLTREAFGQAAAAPGPREAWQVFRRAFRGTSVNEGFRPVAPPPSFEAALLAVRIRAWHRRARSVPVGAAPVIEYLLRVRAQVLQLRAIVWATALGMPESGRRQQLLGV